MVKINCFLWRLNISCVKKKCKYEFCFNVVLNRLRYYLGLFSIYGIRKNK